ncbi:unnamed protein product, partial [Effrenium voratum]
VQRVHSATPSAPDKPWGLVLYTDEVIPGNVLGPAERKIWVIYATFCELHTQNYHKDLWQTIAIARSSTIHSMDHGVAQMMAIVLQSIFCNPYDNLRLVTNEELLQSYQRLHARSATCSKAEFARWQQATGLTYSPHALLLCEPLAARGLLQPVTQFVHDYMHGICQGVAPVVLYHTLQAISTANFDPWVFLEQWLQHVIMPQAQGGKTTLPYLFQAKRVAKYKKSRKFSC